MKFIRLQRNLIYKSIGMLLVIILANSVQMYAQNDKPALADMYKNQALNEMKAGRESTMTSKLKTVVTLKGGQQNLITVLESITRQAGLKLSYSKQFIPLDKKIDVKETEATAETALWHVLENTPFRFGISASGQLVLLRMREKPSQVQQEVIIGTVTDAQSGETLPGVNVMVKGTTTGTSTDNEGSYELNVESLQDTLVFSFIGYQTQEVPINGRSEINIALQPQAIAGEELVITGYTTQRKVDLIGSVDVVDVEAMQNIPTGSALEALQGSASGVNIYNTGSPGESGNLFIRGVSSFGDSSPLVLIDGVEGSLDDVLPSNIESVQVLKDAGAAAIYGVRGSNGVVLITTKKGSNNTPVSISYNSYMGVTMPLSGNPYNLMNPQDQMKVMLEANPNNPLYANGLPDYLYVGPDGAGVAQEGDPEVDPSLYNLDRQDPSNTYLIAKANKEGTNWYQEVFDPALMQNHNVSMRGGTEDATYMLSMGYLNEQGTMLNTYNKKYTARVNTEFDITDNFKIGENVRVFKQDNPVLSSNTGAAYAGLSGVYQMMPIFPIYDIAGNYAGTRLGIGTGSRGNPYALRARADHKSQSWNALGDVFAEIEFLRNFRVRTNLGLNYSTDYYTDFGHIQYEAAEGFADNNYYYESSGQSSRLKWSNILEYNNEFAGRHGFDILIGTEAISYNSRGLSGRREEYFSTDYDFTTLSTGNSNIDNSSSKFQTTIFSIFADLNYSFDDKYLLGVTVRRDGSSKFGEESKYGIFPSLSLGWRISNESFMDGLDWVSELKIRGSYGVLGSQNNVSASNQYTTYGGGFGTAYYPISGSDPQAGFVKQRFGNPLTEWEKDKVTNIGIDLTLFRSFEITAEYYKKEIEGLLFTQDLPATVGGASYPTVNVGNLANTGVDLSLSYSSQFNSDWNFSGGANIGTYKNEVVNVPDPGYFTTGSTQTLSPIIRNQEGQAVSSFFGYDVIGLFQSEEDVNSSPVQDDAAPGRFKYRDVNRDGEITPEDRTFIGNPNPDFTYGLNLKLNYKNFDLSTNIYGSQGGELVNSIKGFTHFFGSYAASAKSNRLKDAWSENNTDTNVPAIVGGSTFSTEDVMNSYFVEDGSYLKMRSLIFGYTIPSELLQKLNVQRLRIYAQSKNLFTITDYSGLDPEIGGASAGFGIDKGTYPGNETAYLFGINLSF